MVIGDHRRPPGQTRITVTSQIPQNRLGAGHGLPAGSRVALSEHHDAELASGLNLDRPCAPAFIQPGRSPSSPTALTSAGSASTPRPESGPGASTVSRRMPAWVGVLGCLDPIKRYHVGIEAAAPLLGDKRMLLVVGDGEERARLEQVALDRGAEKHVIFAGNTKTSVRCYPRWTFSSPPRRRKPSAFDARGSCQWPARGVHGLSGSRRCGHRPRSPRRGHGGGPCAQNWRLRWAGRPARSRAPEVQ